VADARLIFDAVHHLTDRGTTAAAARQGRIDRQRGLGHCTHKKQNFFSQEASMDLF
jgi:hypothetical protein